MVMLNRKNILISLSNKPICFEGTFNSDNLVEHYVERVLKPYFLQNKISKSLLILDQAKCHLKNSFTNALENIGCDLIFIPARLTGISKFYN